MAKKKGGEAITFQTECETEIQWRGLCRKEGLIIVDVYPGWTGPCVSMINIFKRMKVEVNDDRLHFAIACSDKIDDLLMFKDQSEPTWLFLGGGKPVRVMRGCHIPNLSKAIRQEFEHEMNCIEGKARRNLISIDDEESRKKKIEAEAQRLSQYLKDEEAHSEHEIVTHESSIQMATVMSAYTVAIIQPYLQEKTQEIKDFLAGDFNILGVQSIDMDDDSVRQLYRIPYEYEAPQTDFGYNASQANMPMDAGAGEGEEEGAEDAMDQSANKKPSVPKKKMIPVEIPEGVIGPTTFILLESAEIKKIVEGGGKASGALKTADDWLMLKVGPLKLETALEHSPYSLHATYGKGQYKPGVWCPRRYDDKRYVLLKYFSKFLIESLVPAGAEHVPIRYLCFVYPGPKTNEIMNKEEVKSQEADIFASGRMTIPPEESEKMVRPWKISDEEVEQRKLKLSSLESFCMSVNARNAALVKTLTGLDPLHYSVNPIAGASETAALFPDLNARYEEDPDEIMQKFLGRSKKRIPDIWKEEQEMVSMPVEGDDEMDAGFGAYESAAGADTDATVPDKPSSGEGEAAPAQESKPEPEAGEGEEDKPPAPAAEEDEGDDGDNEDE
ncbi:Thioredoxin domain-containing protein 6 [Orchesella cincta]|uniref:Thioredoxin domain-containing protein 6 n=1 Tax=Orchesella cincta TaxID=48709 RepID=A0A1D2MVL0_ORCCI|nr:Thioredoxin domain-containing protein 6 [Orchesella cincta]